MAYSMRGSQVTTTSSVPAPTSTPYKMATSSVTTTSSPKQTALMKKTGKALPASYYNLKVK